MQLKVDWRNIYTQISQHASTPLGFGTETFGETLVFGVSRCFFFSRGYMPQTNPPPLPFPYPNNNNNNNNINININNNKANSPLRLTILVKTNNLPYWGQNN